MNILICQMFLLIFAECLFDHQIKGYVLLSQGKPATLSSQYNTQTPAGNAVDGDLTLTWPNLAVTKEESSVNWYVDLGATRSINSVKIYYRHKQGEDDTYRKRFSGFSLYISDDKQLKSGHKCDVNSTYPPLIYTISCPYTGRYVRLYNSRDVGTAILELAEVQVFGCENSTVYGDNCEKMCSSVCQNNLCHSSSGLCFSCADGYRLVGQNCVECGKCVSGQTCDRTTGQCANNCREGLYPPFCNKGVLSRGKTTNMTSPYEPKTTSDKAVDGHSNEKWPNLAATKFSTSVFWYVDLGVPGNIQSVMIYYRDPGSSNSHYRERFAGFSLYIADDNKNKTGFKCAVSSHPELQYNVSCQYAGRFVKLYNDRKNKSAILELIEVQVFGCSSPTMYGVNCESICPSTCKNNRCSVLSGYCLSCPAGFEGNFCNVSCPSERYGEGCVFQCSGNCKDGESCDIFDGHCKNGCTANYYGSKCSKTCLGFCENKRCNRVSGQCENGCMSGYYNNPYCDKPCSGNCLNDMCDENTGICTNGCEPRYYGPNCSFACTANCKNGANCDRHTGNCNNGCIHGYYGKQCNQICSNLCLNTICVQNTGGCVNCNSGYYGFPHCNTTCSGNCKNNNPCNQNNGRCDNGCKHGFYGDNCTLPCSGNCKNNTNCNQQTGFCDGGCAYGYYSPKCNLPCSGNCNNNNTCNSTSGFCDNGCIDGYKGNKCSEECNAFEYGPGCNFTCGKCKHGKTCNRVSGECDEGCERGYHTPLCNSTCDDGFYGYDCNKNCSGNCKNGTICNATSGFCDNGCNIGYQEEKCDKECREGKYGDGCEEECSINCENGTACHHKTGVCKYGCKDGFYGKLCQSNCSGNCLDGEYCNKTTGICDRGCAAGWESSSCNTMCRDQNYGRNCQSNCGNCRHNSSCNRFNGICEGGCSPGYITELCDTECSAGSYGQGCRLNCSGNCVNNPCKPQDGSCDENGCKVGWKGQSCDIKCSFGFFGDGCSSKCSGNCLNNDTCHHTNGSCLHGCARNWDGEGCAQRAEPLTEPESSSTVGIAVGIVAVVIVVTVIVIIGVYMRRRRKQPERSFSDIDNGGMATPFTEQSNALPQNESTLGNLYANSAEVNGVDRGSPNDETYYNMKDSLIKANQNVKIDELFNVIQNMSKDGKALFSKEYKELPPGEQHACDFAKKQENMPKNRFKTTFPYDHSRVVLQSTAQCNSDYINADYIENVNGDRVYIAAQGPKPNTLTDFWRMVWQERVVKIVMLTNLVEGIKKKCDQYWPDTGKVMRKGDYVIQLQEEKIYASYVIRTLLVTNKTTRQDRMVVHFHYTQWPDHGVPDSLSLVMFYRHVIRTTTIETGKYTVVHCSAGIGRTGTYIALDALYQYGQKTGSVNVPNYVRTMRKDRMSMIQNEDQYVTVYNALHEAFRGRSRVIPKDEFVNEVEKQTNPSIPVNITYLRTSFNELNLLTPSYTKDDFVSGHENIGANFTSTVLPVERFRCNLYSCVKGRGSYYNAVYLQSFSMKDGLVSAQFPLPDFTEDFLRLIEDVEADIVVFVNPLSQIESTHLWMPVTGTPTNVGTITVTIDSPPLCTNNVKKTSLVLKKGESEGHKIDVFEPVSWSVKEPLPLDPRVVLDLANQVQEAQTSKINKRIIVLSADGAGGCGVFCSVFNGLQQLKLDSEVDMFSIIRQLKIRRPEMISNLDEYQFCFKVVAAHLKDDDIYANC